MKKILLNFVDFYNGFDKKNNDFINILNKKYQVVISDNPQYLFYSCFGYEHLKYDCIRIFYTGECVVPDFNEADYAIGYDRLTFGDRYIRIPLYKMFHYRMEYEKIQNQKNFSLEDLREKKGFCSFVYSNCFATSKREDFFYLLNQYKDVASGGGFLNNIGKRVENKCDFQSNYKFSIAFENTQYPGYITEKIMESFVARTIPIYYGAEDIEIDFNEKAFINCHKFENFKDVVKKIIEIDCNDELYLKIINENPLNKDDSSELESFLYRIFEQDYQFAGRRPKSACALERTHLVLRHQFFENIIYPICSKMRNSIVRLKKKVLW